MNNSQNLSSLIWNTADDILRGLFKPSEYGRIILPFVVLRRLDCVIEPQKDKAFKLHEKYKKQVDLIVDGGNIFAEHSTIIDFSQGDAEIIRYGKGPVDWLKNE